MKSILAVMFISRMALFSVEAAVAASPACPDLSGQYEASYVILGVRYDVVSTVTQKDCDYMRADNVITSSHGVQRYTREWIADGIFRRKNNDEVASAVFTPQELMTVEVTSPKDTTAVRPQKSYFSRRDFVFLDDAKNLVNAEERFDEQGVRLGTDRFVYKRRAAR